MYAHTYHSHKEDFKREGAEGHLNAIFKHFILTVKVRPTVLRFSGVYFSWISVVFGAFFKAAGEADKNEIKLGRSSGSNSDQQALCSYSDNLSYILVQTKCLPSS